jgi:hypothetical protein
MSLLCGYAAAPVQKSFCFEPTTRKPRKRLMRHTQADVLLEMLRVARAAGVPLELPANIRARIPRYSARMVELRKEGFEIINEMERVNGAVRSRYYLVFDPRRDTR